ncbi:hypothetical protein IWZ03DRAFT_433735 [Phyllosticta citriasiana]|uniref:Uncharacterized protein n=1 Tax=Phyllosticta citriasiana TaxID=595635 RepID=A0ABR1K9M9_9PEZI
MAPQCQALNLSDESACTGAAHSYASGLFCRFHARQAHGLYKGYQRQSLNQIFFWDIDHVEELKELHTHLFYRHALLDRVIRARKLHTSRFYALDFDYGHKQYLDQLSGQKASVLRALERLERRTAEVMCSKRKWFNWVRHLEDKVDKQREAEKKKVKQEAALFKRHWKEVEKRMRDLRKKEEEKRQQEFLDQAWRERQKLDVEDDSDDMEWDPIEDVVEDERGNYIDLIKHFLWQKADMAVNGHEERSRQPMEDINGNKAQSKQIEPPKSKSAKRNAKRKEQEAQARKPKTEPPKPGDVHIESAAEMRHRLKEGEEIKRAGGLTAIGTIDNPTGFKTAPLSDREVTMLLGQVVEIKHLLFCRLLLSHAALLPAALRANSVYDFLADEEVNNTDLRDLCLKMEQPSLQEIRDACADLGRGEDEEEDDDEKDQVAKPRNMPAGMIASAIPRHFQTERERILVQKRRKIATEEGHSTLVDFGDIDDSGQYVVRKIRVKAMTRSGWLPFSVIAKDCSLGDAIQLCKSWDEFSELSALALYKYFPAGAWGTWGEDHFVKQLMILGFFIFYKFDKADEMTGRHQTPRNAPGRRKHAVMEARNFICGHVKRDDPVSRRFVQYLALMTNRVVLFARDVKTGRVLVQPPKAELWLLREKNGLGRASRGEWNIVKEFGPELFEELDRQRKWSFGFRDYYDICVWDLDPGESFHFLYDTVHTAYIKALRCDKPRDFWRSIMPILRTVRLEPQTGRVRDLFPEEIEAGGMSIADSFEDGTTRNVIRAVTLDEARSGFAGGFSEKLPVQLAYTEADRLEDEILFPWGKTCLALDNLRISDVEEEEEQDDKPMLADQGQIMEHSGNGGFNLVKFVDDIDPEQLDFDSDCEDEDDDEDEDEDGSGISAPDPRLIRKLREAGLPVKRFRHKTWADFKAYMRNHFGDAGGAAVAMKEYEQVASGGRLLGLSEVGTALTLIQSNTAMGLKPQTPYQLIDPGYDLQAMSIGKTKLAATDNPTALDEQMAYEWDTQVEKEKAFAFKDSWHRSDLTANAPDIWEEATSIIWDFDYWMRREPSDMQASIECATKTFKMLSWLHVTPDCDHRIFTDMRRAINMTTLFFSASKRDDFLATPGGSLFKESLILNQEARARTLPPDARSPLSNAKRPPEHWAPVDDILRRNPRKPPFERMPAEWDLTIRPTLAYIYRGGVICPSYGNFGEAFVTALEEPGRPAPDLFIDYRIALNHHGFSVSLTDPDKLEPLLATAQKFAVNRGAHSCFTVLTMWSAAHFWPLTIGYGMRGDLAFYDTAGRCWEWKFVPKDMPFSERSMHKALSLRFAPFQAINLQIREKIVFRCDRVLVMGKDRYECEVLTMAAIWMITTRPWRLEVDPRKSWFGVGLDLLEGLDQKWWTC